LLALRQQFRQLRIELAIGMTTLRRSKRCGQLAPGLPVVVRRRTYPPAKPPAAALEAVAGLVYPKAA